MDAIVKTLVNQLCAGQGCSQSDAEQVFGHIMDGGVDNIDIAALLIALKCCGESADSVTGAANALLRKATMISAPENVVDVCGTGGDGSCSYNISSAVAFLVAAGDVPMAKHGNKAVSSKSGSADVLAALGVNIEADNAVMEKALHDIGVCFLLAPRFHSAMRHVGEVRKQLGVRTIFNMLGPLLNPAGAQHQLIGVYDRALTERIGEVLLRLGRKKAWVVHGSDGMDEITLTGPTYVTELSGSQLWNFTLDPADYGFEYCSADDLRGGDVKTNAQALKSVLQGAGNTAYAHVVILNAAACFVIANRVATYEEGVVLARDLLSSGAAYQKLEQLITITNTV